MCHPALLVDHWWREESEVEVGARGSTAQRAVCDPSANHSPSVFLLAERLAERNEEPMIGDSSPGEYKCHCINTESSLSI
jgi:hypothetical protein